NKDYSCLNGFCPSFVTVEGGSRRKRSGAELDVAGLSAQLPMPELPRLDQPFNLLVTGVGGTGVVTVGALITMAAHLEGLGSSVLDFTGFAQKFGTVLGYVRLAQTPEEVHQVRIDQGGADAVIGCDMVVSSAPKASAHYRRGTRIVLNRAEMPTGDLVLNRDAELRIDDREMVIAQAVGAENLSAFDANAMAEKLMGDAVFANVMMLGYAWQKGLVPVSLTALEQAIELNGVVPDKNRAAFGFGRVMAANPEAIEAHFAPAPAPDDSVDSLIARRMEFLTGYQNRAYAERYKSRLNALTNALPDGSEDLLRAAAKSLFKLMAYKDEYEVARLHRQSGFEERISDSFEGDYKVHYHLAPPAWPTGRDGRGRPNKRKFGPWMGRAFDLLAAMKPLRGTWADPFSYGADRKLEVGLIDWYEAVMAKAPALPHDEALAVLSAPMEIRGYGLVKEAAAEKVQAEVAAHLG
ncbi:MAG TPA: pyruvate ferredoxin oxidoreductase, partial [Sulfitobacter sp.]|nr:pyruvate ferredoxin oxidoreductase [Sulfitobacter sp.]